MASNSSLGAALGGEGTADKIPGRSLPTLVLGRLGYPAGAGAPRLVSAEWRGETDRLYGREREIQGALRDPHNELLTHFLNSAVRTLRGHRGGPPAHWRRREPECGGMPLQRGVFEEADRGTVTYDRHSHTQQPGVPRRRPLHPRLRRKATFFRVYINRMFLSFSTSCCDA